MKKDTSAPACPVSRWDMLKRQLRNLTPAEFRSRMQQDETVLIDVRTRGEYEQFHLPQALHIDYLAPQFWDEMEKLDAGKTYLVYCRSGRRSIRACTLMQNGGFRQVYNLDGGLKAWQEQEPKK